MNEFHSKKMRGKVTRHRRAHLRIRRKIEGTSVRPRLSVYKSLRFIYAQVIDDTTGTTLAQANSRESDLASGLEGSSGSSEAAKAVGALVAERAKAKGIEQVVFDRGGFLFHGKVKTLADAAREKGLVF